MTTARTACTRAPAANTEAIDLRLTSLLAAACGFIAANIYYAQPLAGPIAAELGLSPKAAGLLVTMTQIGYGLGLLLLVPLGDLIENRRLITTMVFILSLVLLATGLAATATVFFIGATLIGLCSVVVQMLVPFAAHLAPEAQRGRVVGNVMTGLMLGIMLARPTSSAIAAESSWHTIYFVAAGVTLVVSIMLARFLPRHKPEAMVSYGLLLASMVTLARDTPVLRRRALYQACLFFAFSLFWTVTPLVLAGPAFGLTQRGIALFALAGVAGAISAPIGGRAADRGHSVTATIAAMLLVAAAFGLTLLAEEGAHASLALFVLAAMVLDFGVQANVVVGSRALFMLNPAHRSRLNGLYMATFFSAGAAGSAIGAWAYAQGGWPLACAIGAAAPLIGLVSVLIGEAVPLRRNK